MLRHLLYGTRPLRLHTSHCGSSSRQVVMASTRLSFPVSGALSPTRKWLQVPSPSCRTTTRTTLFKREMNPYTAPFQSMGVRPSIGNASSRGYTTTTNPCLQHVNQEAVSPLPAAATTTTTVLKGKPVLPSYKTSHTSAERTGMKKKPVADLASGLQRSSCGEDAGPLPPRHLSPLQKRQLLMRNKATFTLTPQAVRRVRYLIERYMANDALPETGKEGCADATGLVVPEGIRIGVRRRGCSGYSYTVNYHFPEPTAAAKATGASGGEGTSAAKAKVWDLVDQDTVVEQEGLKVVVASDALFYVIGTVMDYVVLNVEEKFIFRNPNKKYSCGCEESFMPFDADDMDDN